MKYSFGYYFCFFEDEEAIVQVLDILLQQIKIFNPYIDRIRERSVEITVIEDLEFINKMLIRSISETRKFSSNLLRI